MLTRWAFAKCPLARLPPTSKRQSSFSGKETLVIQTSTQRYRRAIGGRDDSNLWECSETLTVCELQLADQRSKTHLPALKVPSRFALYWQKWNLFYAGRRVFTRADIDQSWSAGPHCDVGTSLQVSLRICISSPTLWLEFQIAPVFKLSGCARTGHDR